MVQYEYCRPTTLHVLYMEIITSIELSGTSKSIIILVQVIDDWEFHNNYYTMIVLVPDMSISQSAYSDKTARM